MYIFFKRVLGRFSPAQKRRRILDEVNELMTKEGHEQITDPKEQSIAYLSYEVEDARSLTQNITITIALAALVFSIVLGVMAPLNRIVASSKENGSMHPTDSYNTYVVVLGIGTLVFLLFCFGVYTWKTLGTSKRQAVLEVVRYRSGLPSTIRMKTQTQSATFPEKRKPIFALIYVDRGSCS